MPIPNPDHLIEQAIRLLRPSDAGPPRQADLRRSVSNAYYSVFHATACAAADEFVGVNKRGEARCSLVYRSINHGRLRSVCDELSRRTPAGKHADYLPPAGLHADLREFCAAVVDLQARRHAADYDPLLRLRKSDAGLAIRLAARTIERLRDADRDERALFLTLLSFGPR